MNLTLKIIIAGLLIASPAFAQKDAKAKALLDKTSAMLNQSDGISVAFSININDRISKEKTGFEGQMLLKGTKFFMDTPEQTVWFDGKMQWVYQKSIEEVSILPPQPQDLHTLNPVLIFDLYKNGCDYKYKGVKTDIQKRKVEEISLFPKDKKDDIRQVDIQINQSDGMPVFFLIIYKNKMENRIYINKYQTQLNLPDSRFVFDKKKYPQAEINDLR